MVFGAEGDALAHGVAAAVVLDALFAWVVAEIALGTLVDARATLRARTQDGLELTADAVLRASKAGFAVVDAAVAGESAALVGAAGFADAHADAARLVTPRARWAVVHTPLFGVAATLDGDACGAGAVTAISRIAGLEAHIGVEAESASARRRGHAPSTSDVANEAVGAIVNAQGPGVDPPTGPAGDGLAPVTKAVALLTEKTIVDALAEHVGPAPGRRLTAETQGVALLILGASVHAHPEAVNGAGRRQGVRLAGVALVVASRPV